MNDKCWNEEIREMLSLFRSVVMMLSKIMHVHYWTPHVLFNIDEIKVKYYYPGLSKRKECREILTMEITQLVKMKPLCIDSRTQKA